MLIPHHLFVAQSQNNTKFAVDKNHTYSMKCISSCILHRPKHINIIIVISMSVSIVQHTLVSNINISSQFVVLEAGLKLEM